MSCSQTDSEIDKDPTDETAQSESNKENEEDGFTEESKDDSNTTEDPDDDNPTYTGYDKEFIAPVGYKLVEALSDEFNGEELDTDKWLNTNWHGDST